MRLSYGWFHKETNKGQARCPICLRSLCQIAPRGWFSICGSCSAATGLCRPKVAQELHVEAVADKRTEEEEEKPAKGSGPTPERC